MIWHWMKAWKKFWGVSDDLHLACKRHSEISRAYLRQGHDED